MAGPELRLEDLKVVLEEVYDVSAKWYILGIFLGMSESRLQEVRLRYSDPPFCLREVIVMWLMSPNLPPTWGTLIDALRNVEVRLAEELRKKYIPTSTEAFDEAMKKGHVKSRTYMCAITGMAGAGKTHTICLLLDKDPPPDPERQSTGLIELSRAISLTQAELATDEKVEEGKWQDVDGKRLLEIVARAAKTTERLEDSSEASGAVVVEDETDLLQLDTKDIKEATGVKNKLIEELAKLMENATASGEVVKVDFIHLLDSGGQIQFHDLLPTFVPNLSANIFVVNLSESLSEKPIIAYYQNGKVIGSTYRSPYSHNQTLQYCLRALQSPISSSVSTEPQQGLQPATMQPQQTPQIAIVATHRDREHKHETLEDKNKQLSNLLQPAFQNVLIQYEHNQPIFPINAKKPKKEDHEVARALRKAILEYCPAESFPTPLPWFVLEQVLKQLAKNRETGVLSMDECRKIAHRLHIRGKTFDEALQFLARHHLFLYYPNVLPQVVFCNPQFLLNKITELVRCSYLLRGDDYPPSITEDLKKGLGGEYQWLRDYGYISEKLLNYKDFSAHYVENLFTPSDLLRLLEAQLIAVQVKINPALYLMPCLLRELTTCEKLDNYRTYSLRVQSGLFCSLLTYLQSLLCLPQKRRAPTGSPEPLLIHFKGWPQSGLFCSLVAYLLSLPNWEIHKINNQPNCLNRNCIEFYHSDIRGTVTLIDSFTSSYFEVHVDVCDSVQDKANLLKTHCPQIRKEIHNGLQKCPRTPPRDECEIAFFCNNNKCCSKKLDPHYASGKPGDPLLCQFDKVQHTNVDEQHMFWDPTLARTGRGNNAFFYTLGAVVVAVVLGILLRYNGVRHLKTCLEVSGSDEVINAIEQHITDWRILGEELKLTPARLDGIDVDNRHNNHKLRATIRAWYDNTPESCWEDVIQALMNMDKKKLASQITKEKQIEWAQFNSLNVH